VLGPEAAQDASSMQPVVHQRVYCDHAGARRHPAFPVRIGPEQQVGEGHRQHLVRDPVNAAQRLQKGLPHSGRPIRCAGLISSRKPLVDPADEVSGADIADEQEQGVCGLVQAPVAEVMRGQGAGADVGGFGAGARCLREAAVVKVPVALVKRGQDG
jgi:hypothetical protein